MIHGNPLRQAQKPRDESGASPSSSATQPQQANAMPIRTCGIEFEKCALPIAMTENDFAL
jgi:hypothetical protein